MFDFLSNKLVNSLKKIKSKNTITPQQIEETLKEIRIALLESDVNFIVVKDFINSLKNKLVGSQISAGLSPYQEVIKVLQEELMKVLSCTENSTLKLKFNPSIILFCGLQGSGKTTSCAKLAHHLIKQNKNPLLVACDIYRPAAVEQLKILATQNKIGFYYLENAVPLKIAQESINYAIKNNYDVVILDTAGRLTIDEEMMSELISIKSKLSPVETLLTVDAMSGQDIINVAKKFDENLTLTGFIVSKLDSETKAGACFSLTYLLKKPIKFIGTGEKISNLDIFYPERIADRMLGLGDVLSVIEKIQENNDNSSQEKLVHRMMQGKFDLNDLLNQMQQMQKFGKLKNVLKLLPGINQKVNDQQMDSAEEKLKITKILISSMTLEERKNPKLLNNNSRKQRIIKGSGRSAQEFNNLMKNFEKMKEQMKNFEKMFKTGNFKI